MVSERDEPEVSARSFYVLGLLLVVYVFNYVDRQLLSILIEPIKAEMGATDTQMGFLTGFAFALFYTVAGIPIAHLADRWVRRSVVAIGLAVWSGMTALTGLSQSYTQLALARIGVGIGEAGGTPPSHSILSDTFPPHWRATALGLFSIGVPLGTVIGYPLGGWLGDTVGWRAAFLWVGLPGILLALIVRLTIREPERGRFDPPAAREAAKKQESVREVFAFLWSLPSFRWMSFGVGLAAFSGYGFAIWKPPFLMRVHGMTMTEAGIWIGITTGATGFISSLLGGYLADRLSKRDLRWSLWMPAAAMACALPFQLGFLLWPDPIIAFAILIPGGLAGGMWPPPTYACAQNLAKPHMRALASAVLLFFLNLIGLGLGPLVVGMMSDALEPSFGGESIRWALVTAMLLNVVGVLFYLLAARSYEQDLRAKEA